MVKKMMKPKIGTVKKNEIIDERMVTKKSPPSNPSLFQTTMTFDLKLFF